ncbi:MAG: hypothetical protein IPG06_12140 [Haliea sp.]|nr:hypothetical protein [Haliea sp.]
MVNSGFSYTVLRPTPMFDWFKRKHSGWLSQFMSASPIFPTPGHGNYERQPMYAGNFTEILLSCNKPRPPALKITIFRASRRLPKLTGKRYSMCERRPSARQFMIRLAIRFTAK